MIRRRPDLSEDALREEVARYWAAPTADENAPAPHETGAAVDLALALEDGAPLFMGGVFDDPSPLSWARAFETADTAGAMALSHEEARANRRILFHAMRSADFVGLRSEWWHYSWGDQAWALRTGAKAAHYGLAGDPRS